MTKNQLKKVAEKSFKNKKLDSTFVSEVAKRLKRSELKEYIRQLYALENKNTVKVFVPTEDPAYLKDVYNSLRKIYKDKKMIVEVDPTLMVGIRIENEDNIYEFSLKNVLSEFVTFIEHKYD